MTQTEMLARLRRRLEADEAREPLLLELLEDAERLLCGYLGREALPEALQGAQCQAAAALYNRLGMEGESRRSEGGVSLTVEALPPELIAQLAPWRLAKAVTL